MFFPFVDLALSRRLERAEAHANRRFVEARARRSPALGAAWIEVSGAYAMFDGVGSPCTQTFGLGMFEPPTDDAMSRIETFFAERGAAVFHEVSPLADPVTPSLLNARSFRPFEFTSVMYRPIGENLEPIDALNERVRVRRLSSDDEQDRWALASARGWSETPELVDWISETGRLAAHLEDADRFVAEVDGEPVATGLLSLHDGVALLAGASTVPEGRRQGAQLALLDRRLRYAASRGCELAIMCALPGSASQRNAERHGFRIAYTRMKWCQTR